MSKIDGAFVRYSESDDQTSNLQSPNRAVGHPPDSTAWGEGENGHKVASEEAA